jgi:hypothetical protein
MRIRVGQIRAVDMHGDEVYNEIFPAWHDDTWVSAIKEFAEFMEKKYDDVGVFIDDTEACDEDDIEDLMHSVSHCYGTNCAVDVDFSEHDLELPSYYELPEYLPDQIQEE